MQIKEHVQAFKPVARHAADIQYEKDKKVNYISFPHSFFVNLMLHKFSDILKHFKMIWAVPSIYLNQVIRSQIMPLDFQSFLIKIFSLKPKKRFQDPV